jgi:hypothetical protein
MRKILHAQRGRPLAIRLPDGTLLAVPPMDLRLPGSARVRIFEYVLRRQIGLAHDIAQIELDVIEGRDRADKRLASMLAETPHATARDHGMAA